MLEQIEAAGRAERTMSGFRLGESVPAGPAAAAGAAGELIRTQSMPAVSGATSRLFAGQILVQ